MDTTPPSLIVASPEVEEAVASFIAQLPSPESQRSYAYEWRRYRAWLGTEQLEAIKVRPRHVQKYMASLTGKKSSNSRALTVLRSLYSAVVVNELMPTNPAREVRAPKVDSTPKTPWIHNDVDVQKLINVPASTWYERRNQVIVRLALGLGWRRAEVARVAVEDIVDNTITAIIKGSKRLTVGVPRFVMASIREWRAFAGINAGPLFPRRTDDPRPCNGAIIYRVVRQMCAKAGIDVVPPHAIRRTYITRGGARGAELEDLQFSVGHASISTTERYRKANDAAVNSPGDVFEDLVNK